MATLDELKQLAREHARRVGLPEDVFLAQINQESGWDHAAVSPAGARGLLQIMPKTGAQPGFNVRPLANNSPEESIRFGADYMGAMLQRTNGDMSHALAAYNAGLGAVQQARGVPAFAETQDYVKKILGVSSSGAMHVTAPPAPVVQTVQSKFAKAEAERAAAMDAVRGLATVTAPLTDPIAEAATAAVEASKVEQARKEANQATAGDAFQYGVANNLFGSTLDAINRPPAVPGYKPDGKQLAAEGWQNDPAKWDYLKGATSPDDLDSRLAKMRMNRETEQSISDATGLSGAVVTGGVLLGGLVDPVGFASGAALGAPFRALQVTQAMRTLRTGRVSLNVAEGAAGNALLEAGVQLHDRTAVSWNEVAQQAAFGAVFGSVSAPLHMIRYGGAALDMHKFSATSEKLAQAVANGAEPAAVAAITKNLDDIKVAMSRRAAAGGDLAALEVAAVMGPGTDRATMTAAIKARHAELDLAVHAADPDHVTARNMADGDTPVVVHGVRLSPEAGSITTFAKNIWDESIPDSLKGMQRRQREFQTRVGDLTGYKGLKEYLDSPGLILQRSNSKVVRMLGAHLAESSTGLGRRENSAALNYEMWHSKLAHKYIPELKEAEAQHIKSLGAWEAAKHYTVGAGSDNRAAFWKAVQEERLGRRNATRDGVEFASEASAPVRSAAQQLDHLVREAADLMERNGIDEGKFIREGGWEGYMPYQWNNQKLLSALRDDPEAFEAVGSLLHEEFSKRILKGTWADLQADSGKLVDARKTSAEQQIVEVQGKIAALEQARRDLTVARDAERDASGQKKQHFEQLQVLRDTQTKLEKELADAEALVQKVEEAGTAGEAPTITELPWLPGSTLEAARADTSLTEISQVALVGAVDRVVKSSPLFQPIEKALWAALKNDLRNEDMPVFLQAGTPTMTSHYQASGNFLVLTGLWDKAKLTPSEAKTAMHELAHSVTTRWIYKVQAENGLGLKHGTWLPPQVFKETPGTPAHVTAAVNSLEEVRGKLMAAFPDKVGQKHGLGYAMKNSHELIAQVMNSAYVREALSTIDMGKKKTALRRVWEAVARIIGNGEQESGLDAIIRAYDTLTHEVGVFKDRAGNQSLFAPERTPHIIRTELEHVKALAEAEKTKHKAASSFSNTAKAAAKSVREQAAVKQVRELELHLARAKADLADIQADPLGWFGKQVKSLQTNADSKAKALTSNYMQQILKDPESRQRSMVLHISRMAEDLLNENWAGKDVSPELAEKFGELLRDRLASRERTELDLLASRTTPMGNKVALLDFMETDGLAMSKSVLHRSAGSAAMGRMGLKDATAVEAAIEAARMDGATAQEMAALRHMVDLFGGSSHKPDAPVLHALRNLTYATRMGKLGSAMLADIPAVAANFGLSAGIQVLTKSIGQVLPGGKPSPLMRQLATDAPGLLGQDYRLMTLVPDHPQTGAADLGGQSAMQRASVRGAQFTSMVSGANVVDKAIHRAFVPMFAEKIVATLADPLQGLHESRMADLGLYPDRIQRVQTQLSKYDSGRKQGDRINWDKWEDQEAADWLIGALHRGTHQAIQRSLGGEKPSWLLDSTIGRLIGQFRSFGLTASEKMSSRLLLGHKDSDAMVGAVLGLAWAGMIYYSRVQVAASNRKDREKFIEESMSGARLMTGVLNLWNVSGLAADVTNVGEILFGGSSVSSGPAPVLGVLGDVAKAAGAPVAVLRGKTEPGDAAKQAVRALPGGNSIPFMTLMNAVTN